MACMRQTYISTSSTMLVAAIDMRMEIRASAWVSFPDNKLLADFEAAAFVFHVAVAAPYRRQGLGTRLLKVAVELAEQEGADAVYLAASDPDLRQNFYQRLGFYPVGDDPWLLSKALSNARSQLKSQEYQEQIRRVSPHDLGTLQSIRGQDHWVYSAGVLYKRGPTECEEEFCEIFRNDQKQFLISGAINDHSYVAWCHESTSDWIIYYLSKNMPSLSSLSHLEQYLTEVSNHRVSEILKLGEIK